MTQPEKCRTCRQSLPSKARENLPFYPFCSQRCRLLDMGQWFDEKYRLHQPGTDETSEQDKAQPDQSPGQDQ